MTNGNNNLTIDSFLSIFPEFNSVIPAIPDSNVRIEDFNFSTDRFTRVININSNLQATLSYVQVASTTAADRGRWLLVFGQIANPFDPKTVKALKFKPRDGNMFLTSPLSVDATSTNALTYKSTTSYTVDPDSVSGSDGVYLQYNIILNDDSLVFDDVAPDTPAERTRFTTLINAVTSFFHTESYLSRFKTGINESVLMRVQGLLVAHIASLVFLNKAAGGQFAGDESSFSVSEGGFSVSSGRITYDQFLSDPYLSRTRYGAELAFYLRASGPAMLTVNEGTAAVQTGEVSEISDLN